MEQLSLFNPNDERSSRQEELIDIWIKHKCKGTLVCPTGFGKTRVGLLAIEKFQKKNPDKLIIVAVPSDPVKVQWLKELEDRKLRADVRTYYDTSRHKYDASLVILDK